MRAAAASRSMVSTPPSSDQVCGLLDLAGLGGDDELVAVPLGRRPLAVVWPIADLGLAAVELVDGRRRRAVAATCALDRELGLPSA